MFDVQTPEEYFFHIQQSITNYQKSKNKSIERLFFILNGLNHLREWIAPNYKPKYPAQNKGEDFFNLIWKFEQFKTINELCNGTKHFDCAPANTKGIYGLPIDEWDSVDDVQNFDEGPPIAFTLNGIDVLIYIREVLDFYEHEWFSKMGRSE